MATKQQVREQITDVIQEGILTKVLPYRSINGEFNCSIFNGQESYCNDFGDPCNYYDGICAGYSFCYDLSQQQINKLIDDNYLYYHQI